MTEAPQQVPRHRFLTEAQIDQLPSEIQGHYREHTWLRHPDDLQYFPEPVRATLQRLIERSHQHLLEHIARKEDRHAS